MIFDLRLLAQDLAQRAGDLLRPVPDRNGAKRLLLAEIEVEHPALGATERAQVADWTLALLEADDFFGVEYVGNPFADSGEAGDPD
ncbi:MAG: hypothetical protein FJ381_04955 [Verrucomicrobia bacterium]|nr:hypothetical protein [Verrucomicrobiota bacterium]